MGMERREGLMEEERELLKGNTPALILAVLKEAALHALEREGLVAGAWEMPSGERKRKIYTLTPAGRAELERRTRTWNLFATAIQSVLGGSDHELGVDERPTTEQNRAGLPALPHIEPAG